MSEAVQITLIICVTIIICYSISCFKQDTNDNKPKLADNENDTSRLDKIFDMDRGVIKCKNPTYSRPPRPGYQPKHDNSELAKMRKPPKTGSGIK